MVRVQLDIPEERIKQLDALMALMGITTRKELFNNALTLLEWAAAEKRNGRVIASVDEHQLKLKELVMPALERVSVTPVMQIERGA